MKIQDIAKLANVSASTVSRVFSNHPRIREEVRQRVLAIAKQYNYSPRVTGKQRNITILIPDDPGYPAHYCVEILVMSLSNELSCHNFRTEILPWNNRDRLRSIPFHGVAAIGIDAREFREWDCHFAQPLVVLDRDIPRPTNGVWQVSSDEWQGMELAVARFREGGIRKVGCLIYGDPGHGNADIRFLAAKEALAKYGYPTEGNLFAYTSSANYFEIVGEMLSYKVDALLCPGHSGGVQTAYALNLFGKRIPEEISLIASELCFFSPYATPPQTTLTPDYLEIARKTVEIFQTVLCGGTFPAKTVLPYKLTERKSVRRN
ncbi:MAG: LacI family transcriptional regulator [Victivallales bacterium]|jgi:LacI family transcriptional regulator|nr:LacI family transcriptional regulator [Victivallales bacterium]